jgi:hypothetical protein
MPNGISSETVQALKELFRELTRPDGAIVGDPSRADASRDVLTYLASVQLHSEARKAIHPIDAVCFSEKLGDSEHLFDRDNKWFRVLGRETGALLEFQSSYGPAHIDVDWANRSEPRIHLFVFNMAGGWSVFLEGANKRIYSMEMRSSRSSAAR